MITTPPLCAGQWEFQEERKAQGYTGERPTRTARWVEWSLVMKATAQSSRSQGFESEKLPGFLSRVTRKSRCHQCWCSRLELLHHFIYTSGNKLTKCSLKRESLISLRTTDIIRGFPCDISTCPMKQACLM